MPPTKNDHHDEPEDATDEAQPLDESADDDNGGRSWTFYAIAGVGGSMGLCLVLFVVALIIGVASGDSGTMADFVAVMRDLLIIFMVLQGIVVGAGLIIVIYQAAVLINILQNEIDPVVEGTQETIATARGTATFISRHLTEPIIRGSAFLSGARRFMREISGIQSLIDSQDQQDASEDDANADNSPEVDEDFEESDVESVE
jgi:hypothetical protein